MRFIIEDIYVISVITVEDFLHDCTHNDFSLVLFWRLVSHSQFSHDHSNGLLQTRYLEYMVLRKNLSYCSTATILLAVFIVYSNSCILCTMWCWPKLNKNIDIEFSSNYFSWRLVQNHIFSLYLCTWQCQSIFFLIFFD